MVSLDGDTASVEDGLKCRTFEVLEIELKWAELLTKMDENPRRDDLANGVTEADIRDVFTQVKSYVVQPNTGELAVAGSPGEIIHAADKELDDLLNELLGGSLNVIGLKTANQASGIGSNAYRKLEKSARLSLMRSKKKAMQARKKALRAVLRAASARVCDGLKEKGYNWVKKSQYTSNLRTSPYQAERILEELLATHTEGKLSVFIEQLLEKIADFRAEEAHVFLKDFYEFPLAYPEINQDLDDRQVKRELDSQLNLAACLVDLKDLLEAKWMEVSGSEEEEGDNEKVEITMHDLKARLLTAISSQVEDELLPQAMVERVRAELIETQADRSNLFHVLEQSAIDWLRENKKAGIVVTGWEDTLTKDVAA